MALVVKDRVKETTTTTGTGTITLAGAVAGFQSFSVVGDGNTTHYAIESGVNWEIGVGTYTATGTTLSRDTILESSNSGSAISLSGTSTVFCTYPAEKSVNTDDIGSTIQGYDADTAKYDDTTANFTGTLQNGGSNVVVDTDIGSTVQAYDADTAKYDDVTANFTGTLQQGGSNVLTGNQTITLSGDASGSGTTSITVTVADDSHNHIIGNVDGLQTALDNKQPLDADLTSISGLSSADGNFIVGSATGWVAESGATARTSLGLGTAATSATGDFATAAQGSLADSAVQPSDNISTLTNDSGFITGNQTITLSGDASGSGTTSIVVTVADDSHNHVISNVDGLQTALDAKAPIASPTFTGTATTPDLQITGGALVKDVTGSYGSIEVDGGATGGYEGYSIGGRVVFMHNNSTTSGLYNDVDNHWIMRGVHGGLTALYYNGSSKLETSGTGVTITGTATATTFSGALSGNATTATTLQTARTINGVSFNGSANITVEPYIEDDNTTNATRYMVFTDNSTGGYKRLNEDSSLTYNPSTNTLTAGAFVGDGSGLTGVTAAYSVEYVIIAGGGSGGGRNCGGGGGAGGYLSGTTSLIGGAVYSFTIGAGGSGVSGSDNLQGNNGNDTTALSLTCNGGGGGGHGVPNQDSGNSGGSGGGGGGGDVAPSTSGGSGTSGQGNSGGTGYAAGFQPGAGGGGGKGASGSNGSANTGGNGGAGTASSITGSSVTRAGGGGGGANVTAGTGGSGGGGNGAAGNPSGTPTSGTANTGSGGGGLGGFGTANTSGSGGSGVVILKVLTSDYSGTTTGSPTVTTSGSYTIMQFNSSGSYTA